MDDIVKRLQEPIIADAFASGLIGGSVFAERLIRERRDAATEIERLRAALTGSLTIKNFGARSDEWLDGFQAGVDARDASIKEALANEQDAKR